MPVELLLLLTKPCTNLTRSPVCAPLAVRPIHRRTDITRGQRETRRDGRGEDSTEAPAADGRNRASASRPASLGAEASDRGRPREQHPLRGSTRSHRRPPARSSSSSSSGARPTARPQQQQQHQQPQHQQQTATQQQHHKFARSEHHNLGRSGATSSRQPWSTCNAKATLCNVAALSGAMP